MAFLKQDDQWLMNTNFIVFFKDKVSTVLVGRTFNNITIEDTEQAENLAQQYVDSLYDLFCGTQIN